MYRSAARKLKARRRAPAGCHPFPASVTRSAGRSRGFGRKGRSCRAEPSTCRATRREGAAPLCSARFPGSTSRRGCDRPRARHSSSLGHATRRGRRATLRAISAGSRSGIRDEIALFVPDRCGRVVGDRCCPVHRGDAATPSPAPSVESARHSGRTQMITGWAWAWMRASSHRQDR